MNIWAINHYATPPDTPRSTRQFDLASSDRTTTRLRVTKMAGFIHLLTRGAEAGLSTGIFYTWLCSKRYNISEMLAKQGGRNDY